MIWPSSWIVQDFLDFQKFLEYRSRGWDPRWWWRSAKLASSWCHRVPFGPKASWRKILFRDKWCHLDFSSSHVILLKKNKLNQLILGNSNFGKLKFDKVNLECQSSLHLFKQVSVGFASEFFWGDWNVAKRGCWGQLSLASRGYGYLWFWNCCPNAIGVSIGWCFMRFQ